MAGHGREDLIEALLQGQCASVFVDLVRQVLHELPDVPAFQQGRHFPHKHGIRPETFVAGSMLSVQPLMVEHTGSDHFLNFRLGDTPVNQALWTEVMGDNPSRFVDPARPVEQVSWEDVQVFLQKLNQKYPGRNYRLLTEAEWEYAARGGKQSKGYQYSGSNNIYEVAWFADNSLRKTYPVGTKKANELGLHDMSGNVWEWCADWFDSDYYKKSPKTAPKGPDSGDYRVVRGGSWHDSARLCRSAYRLGFVPGFRGRDLGFRLVLAPRSVF
jgi:formylglycine-generating enzyme required for sulfatase activity